MFRLGFNVVSKKIPLLSTTARYIGPNDTRKIPWLGAETVCSSTRHYWKPTAINDKVELAWKTKDGIDEKFRIIYSAPHQTLILGSHYFSCFSYATVAFLGYMATTNYLSFADSIFVDTLADYCGFLGLLCLSSFQLSAAVLHYPLRIYKEKEGPNYVAIFLGFLPRRISKVHFKAEEVRQIQNLISGNNIFQLGRRKGYLVPHYFVKTEDFTKMTGLEEPVDEDD